MKQSNYFLDGCRLTVDEVVQAVRGELGTVGLTGEAIAKCEASRAQVTRWLVDDAPAVYGVNTGLGNLKDSVLSLEEHLAWNKTIPYPHAVGLGEYLNPAITRASMLIRANVLSRGYSGVRSELIHRMLSIFNQGIAAAIRELGSTGLSDLGPLAHNAMVVSGLEEAEVFYKGQRMLAQDCFAAIGLEASFPLECKEALAQMNGSTMTQAIAVYACHNMQQLINIEKKIDSIWAELGLLPFAAKAKVDQAVDKAFRIIANTVNFENNITCDNPLLFEAEDGYEAVMGCNCSNTQIGYVMDLLAILLADKANVMIELFNRLEREKNLNISGIREHALARVGYIQSLCLPASADSLPTKANQEDHVEFSYGAARKAMKALQAYQFLLSSLLGAVDRLDAAAGNYSKVQEQFPGIDAERAVGSKQIVNINNYLSHTFDLVPLLNNAD
ncbi:aromatic amino acid lyase [Paenibacillaceae bacterium]|nr:aromatic amino acid lyase [Paenibacillaceae bacterium]